MNDLDQSSFSRRRWLGMVSTVSAGLAAGNAGAQSPQPSNDLGARIYNIRDFGAKGDGATLDTAAVQAAIDTCTKDQGGTVLVPAGVFVIGTVEMKSNVTLHMRPRANCWVPPMASNITRSMPFRCGEIPL